MMEEGNKMVKLFYNGMSLRAYLIKYKNIIVVYHLIMFVKVIEYYLEE